MWIQKLIFIFDDIHIFDPGSGYDEKDPRQLQINCLGFLFCHPCQHFVRVLKEIRNLTVA